jgi:hypothetical protein
MAISDEVRAAVGGLAIETTWLEYLAARLAAIAGTTDNEMALLAPGADVFKQARKASAGLQDVELRGRTLAWLKRAKALQEERNRVVHSIVLHDGRSGWHGYHPKNGSLRRLSAEEIVELAEQARAHADDGVYMSIFEWSPAFSRGAADEPGQTATPPA